MVDLAWGIDPNLAGTARRRLAALGGGRGRLRRCRRTGRRRSPRLHPAVTSTSASSLRAGEGSAVFTGGGDRVCGLRMARAHRRKETKDQDRGNQQISHRRLPSATTGFRQSPTGSIIELRTGASHQCWECRCVGTTARAWYLYDSVISNLEIWRGAHPGRPVRRDGMLGAARSARADDFSTSRLLYGLRHRCADSRGRPILFLRLPLLPLQLGATQAVICVAGKGADRPPMRPQAARLRRVQFGGGGDADVATGPIGGKDMRRLRADKHSDM